MLGLARFPSKLLSQFIAKKKDLYVQPKNLRKNARCNYKHKIKSIILNTVVKVINNEMEEQVAILMLERYESPWNRQLNLN